jgi:Fe-S-cluster-containing dehydrogenase component
MARYGMVIDISKCIGCYNCFLACRDEFAGNEYKGYASAQPMEGQNWIRVIEKERGQYPKVKVSYTPILCMHCDDAPCIKMARDGAVYKRADGIVIIDPVKAKGQKELISLNGMSRSSYRRNAHCAHICWTKERKSRGVWRRVLQGP